MTLEGFVQKINDFYSHNQELAKADVVVLTEDGESLDITELDYDEDEKTVYMKGEFC